MSDVESTSNARTYPIGTPAFFQTLLARIHDVISPTFPLEPALLQSILLCLIGGKKHLVLRTSGEDLSLVVRLVASTLSSVFGFSTHKLRIHQARGKGRHLDESHVRTSSRFLRSLFLPAAAAASNSNANASSDGYCNGHGHGQSGSTSASRYHKHGRLTMSRSRSRSQNLINPLNPPHPPSFARSRTLPSEPYTASSQSTATTASVSRDSGSATPRTAAGRPPSLVHVATDPVPTSHSGHRRLHRANESTVQYEKEQIELPNGLIISGLENAATVSQLAFSQALLERRVVLKQEHELDEGEPSSRRKAQSPVDFAADTQEPFEDVYPFPDEFIVVYVCLMDPQERPAIHKSLLDKFAMSATISLHPNIRSLAAAYYQSYRSPPLTSPTSTTPQSTPPYFTRALPNVAGTSRVDAPVSSELLKALREAQASAHFPPALNLYMADLFTAARHHPRLEGRLLTATAMDDARDLAVAWRVLGGDMTGTELVEATARSLEAFEAVGSGVSLGLSVRSVTIDAPPSLDAVEGEQGEGEQEPVRLDVCETDVARIVPRVMSHRLRIRDGPASEVFGSMVFGATMEETGVEEYRTTTVKDVLIGILSEV